jgi:hypothetical protein
MVREDALLFGDGNQVEGQLDVRAARTFYYRRVTSRHIPGDTLV